MRFLQAAVLLVGAALYLVLLSTPFTFSDGEQFGLVVLWTVVGWAVASSVVSVLVIVDAVRKLRSGNTRALATGALLVKIAAIPFFLFTFVLLNALASLGAAFFLFGGMVLHVAVGIGIGLSYLVMLSTSIYNFASIVQLRREGRIDAVLTVLYTVLSLVVISDVVAGVMLFAHSRRRLTTSAIAVPTAGSRGAASAGR